MTAELLGPTDFVRTVLLVDDQAYTSPPVARGHEEPRGLDAREVVHAMADVGISCTLLAPGEADGADRARVVNLSRTADVVVLDWILKPGDSGDGHDSLPLLQAIVRADLADGGRLRAVVIYTGHERISDIVRDVVDGLAEEGVVATSSSDGTVDAPNLRVAVVGKPDSRALVLKASPSDLAKFVVADFLQAFGGGLLRRVALEGVTSIRRQAHQLLVHFPPAMDAAFLSHRAMTSSVAAEEFAEQLVASDLAYILQEARINRWVFEDRIGTEVRSRLSDDTVRRHVGATTISSTEAVEVLTNTLESYVQGPCRKAPTLTTLLSPGTGRDEALEYAAKADESFTILALYASHVGSVRKHAPRLRLGTVLRRADGTHALCMQPLCDSVRLGDGESAAFPLLPLEAAKDGRFDLITPDQPRQRLAVATKLNRLLFASFQPNDRGTVAGVFVNDAFMFTSEDGAGAHGEVWEWVGDLRLDRAHRIAARLGADAGRIGLDEPEWSRRKAPR